MDSYKVVGRIGEGAHGLVLRARNRITGKDVALKKISVKRLNSGIPVQVIREIKCLQIVDSEHVVQLLEVFPQGMGFVLVFEYMPSGLWEMIHDAEYLLDETHMKSYMIMLLKGVKYLHFHNIMHRDLKPANLLIDQRGILKIADLGLGRILYEDDNNHPYSHQVATRWYRAPELLYGARYYNEAVDMWAVGCIVAEILTNAPLFPGETDIEQLVIVLRTLGTPSEDIWPGLSELPDYNKITFNDTPGIPFTDILPDASLDAIDLISHLILYDSSKRFSAKEALIHPYFFTRPMPCPPNEMPKPGDEHRKMFVRKGDYNVTKPLQDLFEDLGNVVLSS